MDFHRGVAAALVAAWGLTTSACGDDTATSASAASTDSGETATTEGGSTTNGMTTAGTVATDPAG
ncbi:MAG: hypothetical protein KC636_28705, partial [Myxococcales bacterium]|nr:hypothetical protein [Myxococcales bacterium]